MDSVDLQVLKSACDWMQTGHRVVLVTVVKTWGSAPRPIGALTAIRDDGMLEGSVSGGCIEDDLIDKARGGVLASGLPQVLRPDGTYRSQTRFGMYRWHLSDPIRFDSDLRVTIQALGWRTEKKDRRYLPLQDDIASVAFWYQTLPTAPFPK